MSPPCVPRELADSALYALTVRGGSLDILLHGHGTAVEKIMLDGKCVQNPIPYGDPGEKRTLEIWLRR